MPLVSLSVAARASHGKLDHVSIPDHSTPDHRVLTAGAAEGLSLADPRPVPWGGVLDRVRASVGARRLVPTGLALAGTDLLYHAALRLSGRRAEAAEASMAAVVGGTSAEPDLARLARRQVAAEARGWELTWRPWELERVPMSGVAHLNRARDSGRGVLVSYPHMGPPAAWVPLARRLRPLYMPVGDWVLEEPRAGYNGYQVEQRRKIYSAAGFQLIHASGSARTLLRLLGERQTVFIAMDLPGPRTTEFLGKPVEMADGTARLAARTDSLVVPAALLPSGRRWRIEIREAVDPRDHSSPAELHQALAAIHSDFVLSAPDHLESPLRPGGWARVTREGWYRT